MRNPFGAIVLFYSLSALLLAVVVVVLRQSSLVGLTPEALSNACENLVLIAVAMGVWGPWRRVRPRRG